MTRGRPLVALSLAAVTLALVGLRRRNPQPPANRPVGPSPDFPAHSVSIPTAEGGAPGRLALARSPQVTALCPLHGTARTAGRCSRARFWAANGYATLAVGQQAHGETPARRITFGAREAEGSPRFSGLPAGELPGAIIAVMVSPRGGRHGPGSTKAAARRRRARIPLSDHRAGGRQSPRHALLVRRRFARAAVSLAIALGDRRGARDLHPIAAIADLRCPGVDRFRGAKTAHALGGRKPSGSSPGFGSRRVVARGGNRHVDLHGFAPAEYEAPVLEFPCPESALPRASTSGWHRGMTRIRRSLPGSRAIIARARRAPSIGPPERGLPPQWRWGMSYPIRRPCGRLPGGIDVLPRVASSSRFAPSLVLGEAQDPPWRLRGVARYRSEWIAHPGETGREGLGAPKAEAGWAMGGQTRAIRAARVGPKARGHRRRRWRWPGRSSPLPDLDASPDHRWRIEAQARRMEFPRDAAGEIEIPDASATAVG